MPLFVGKKGGKNERKKKDCSYETVDYLHVPKLHSLVLGEASTAKIKGFIAKKVSNINETDKNGRTALHYAASIGNEKAIHILLQCGLKIDLELKDDEGKTALFKAVEVFSANCVHVLLEHKAATDVWDNHQSTPLHIATVNRKTVIISLINNAHGNLNVKDKMGFSPLHVASAFGYLETAKELIDAGADINAKDSLGRTPLMAAACEGTPKMVHLLLGYGADPTVKDNFNHTAIDHSKQNQSESMTKIIKEAVAQRGYARVASTEPEYTTVSIVKSSGDGDTKTHSEPDKEVVIKIESIDNGDRMPAALEDENEQELALDVIEEDVQKAVDVVAAHATVVNLEGGRETMAPANGDRLVERAHLQAESLKEDDAVLEPGPDIQQDSLQLLKKKRASNVVGQKKVSFYNDFEKEDRQKLLSRNRLLKEENYQLKNKLSELLKQTNLEADKQQRDLEIKKSQLQLISMKNRVILEQKIKQCSKLEVKLKDAHDQLITEIEKTKEGSNLDVVTKDLVKELNKKLKSSDAKITRLFSQLKSSREGKYVLETQVCSLKGEIIILKEIIEKQKSQQKYFQKINTDSGEKNDDKQTLMFYQEQYERSFVDNEAMQDTLNTLRRENAMLKEQHLSDKHETQMIRNELNDTEEQVITLQYQLDNMKVQNTKTRELSYRDLLEGNQNGMTEMRKLRHDDMLRVANVNLERSKSDSTLHGFRTFDSSADMLIRDKNNMNSSPESKYRAADLSGME